MQCSDKAAEFEATHRDAAFIDMPEPDCANSIITEGADVPDPLVELCRYLDHALAQVRFLAQLCCCRWSDLVQNQSQSHVRPLLYHADGRHRSFA